MLMDFDGDLFKPHEIIPAIPIELGWKKIMEEVEVVDSPFDYNLLLGRIWTQVMMAIVSLIFCILKFPHNGNIITIERLSFSTNVSNHKNGSNVPLGRNSMKDCEILV